MLLGPAPEGWRHRSRLPRRSRQLLECLPQEGVASLKQRLGRMKSAWSWPPWAPARAVGPHSMRSIPAAGAASRAVLAKALSGPEMRIPIGHLCRGVWRHIGLARAAPPQLHQTQPDRAALPDMVRPGGVSAPDAPGPGEGAFVRDGRKISHFRSPFKRSPRNRDPPAATQRPADETAQSPSVNEGPRAGVDKK